MRRWILVVCLLIPVGATADVIRGAWHLTRSEHDLQFELSHDRNSHSGETMAADAFRGLSPADIDAKSETPVHFQLVREAGTFDLTGTFLNGDGVGRFTFTPDASYAGQLRSMGVATSDISDSRLYMLALLDVSSAFIREMQSLGYHESLDRYIAFRIHGATPQFVRDVRALGYDDVPAEMLIAFRIHGVSPQYIKDLRSESVVGLESEHLIALRIHGASIDYVRELGSLGYRNLSSEQLVEMRIHGVTPQYIRDLGAAGYHGIPVEKLVQMRIRGIDADFVRKAK